jgi:hypothetical protein
MSGWRDRRPRNNQEYLLEYPIDYFGTVIGKAKKKFICVSHYGRGKYKFVSLDGSLTKIFDVNQFNKYVIR